MNTFTKSALAALIAVAGTTAANAQYYQLANQATNMLSTVLRGGFNYRGTVDVAYLSGIGDKRASFLEFTTTQGVKYSEWLYMGLGAGVDVMFNDVSDTPYQPVGSGKGYTDTAVMVPLYTDFRVNFGQPQKTGAFIDLRVGAAFYVSNKCILVGDGYINSSESFYLKPSVGVRIPVSKTNPKLAFNISASYQLLTNGSWYNPYGNRNVTLSSFGATVGYEW